MKQYVSLVALSLLSLQAAALDLAKHPQVFDAGQGVSLALAPSADGTQALVQVRGINHPLDEVVFLTDIRELGNEQRDYGIRLDGRDYNLLNKRLERRELPAQPAEHPGLRAQLQRGQDQGAQAEGPPGDLPEAGEGWPAGAPRRLRP